MSNRIDGSNRKPQEPIFHVVPTPDPPKRANEMTQNFPSVDLMTSTQVTQFVVNGQKVAGTQPDWSALPDDVLVKQESAARTRKDDAALRSIAKEWDRRKQLRAEPGMPDPKTLKTSFDVAAERVKHERFIEFASNPFNKVPDTQRKQHEAYVASLEPRAAELERDEAARIPQKVNEFVATLRSSGAKMSAADEQKVRDAYEHLLRHPPSFPGPAIGPAKDGVPLEEAFADARARWEIVHLAASNPLAAAAFGAAIVHGDTPEQAVTRMEGAKDIHEALEAHLAGSEHSADKNFFRKDTFH